VTTVNIGAEALGKFGLSIPITTVKVFGWDIPIPNGLQVGVGVGVSPTVVTVTVDVPIPLW